MNINDFSLWAQNLNNKEDDYAKINGDMTNNYGIREELAEKISEVSLNGYCQNITDKSVSSTLYFVDTSFVLKITWSQTDNLGRKAPIICYGNIESFDTNEFICFKEQCINAIINFCDEIKRSFSTNEKVLIMQVIDKSLDSLKFYHKNHSRNEKNIKISKKKIIGVGFICSTTALVFKVPPILSIIPILTAIGLCLLKDYNRKEN